MNHKGAGKNDDSPQSVLTTALERAALVNYKYVYGQLEAASEGGREGGREGGSQ